MSEYIERCTKCIMPFNYPKIEFDNNGVCNYCRIHKERKYLGSELLKRDILFHARANNSKYDCAVSFSGGRDSSYLLYYLSQVLKLNVVAFTVNNGYLPPETIENIRAIPRLLNVDIAINKHSYLDKCFNYHLKTWYKKPTAAMVPALCVGCKLGMEKGIYQLFQKNDVSVYIWGGTPFEGNQYKTNLLRSNPYRNDKFSLVLGYLLQVFKNYNWSSNPYCLWIQINEFFAFYGKRYRKKLKNEGVLRISPFRNYIRWEEDKITSTLNTKLDWKENKKTGSSWRGDCHIAILKQYLYLKILGFNDKDDALSDLIRDGQISRKSAIDRLQREHYIDEEEIIKIIKKQGLKYSDIQIIHENIKKDYFDN
ncbi:MAG: hypothetical protein K9G76_10570 [Bacteroidales bacterium]|nr:hypothetical protein [Bacteroidales bacterium]MCF8405798.1 hypothetical protein [Bacteroidales bacterium]